MNKEDMRKKIESLEEEEKDLLRELLETKKKDDPDIVDSILKIEKRISELENLIKTPEKKKSFFETLFD